jgi:hypothetical protein
MIFQFRYIFSLSILLWACNNTETSSEKIAGQAKNDSAANCGSPHSRAAALAGKSAGSEVMITLQWATVSATVDTSTAQSPGHPGWLIPGASSPWEVLARKQDPMTSLHPVAVDGFWMDQPKDQREFKLFADRKSISIPQN